MFFRVKALHGPVVLGQEAVIGGPKHGEGRKRRLARRKGFYRLINPVFGHGGIGRIEKMGGGSRDLKTVLRPVSNHRPQVVTGQTPLELCRLLRVLKHHNANGSCRGARRAGFSDCRGRAERCLELFGHGAFHPVSAGGCRNGLDGFQCVTQ